MSKPLSNLVAATLCLAVAAAPLGGAWAQDAGKPQVGNANPNATPTDQPAPAPAPEPAPPKDVTGQPTGEKATVNSPAGTLAVAAVKMDTGMRASKLIGSTVYNEHNDKIGSVDDLILTDQNKVVVAIISVGGFLGLGSKLVAVPYDQLHMQNGRVNLVGADKNALNALPSFTYSNT